MLKKLIKLANLCDEQNLTSEANKIDAIIDEFLTSPFYKTAGAEKLRDLPIIASTVIFKKTGKRIEVLLEKRKKDPKAHSWALPGGHVEKKSKSIEEDFAVAAARELLEETNIRIKPKDLTFVTCKPRDIGIEKLDIAFMAVITEAEANFKAGSDAEEVHWISLDNIPDLAFDHNYFLEVAIKRLNDKNHDADIDISKLHSKIRSNRGTLIVFEGLDGSGKSSQIEALYEYLKSYGHKVKVTKWASSDTFKKSIKDAKEYHMTPELYSLLHMTDMHDRYWNEIMPWLAKGHVVLCDRYVYTSFARDTVRGIDPDFIKLGYNNFIKPDIVFYCKCPIDITVKRINKKGKEGFGYYGSGQDLHLDSDPRTNLIKYQKMVSKVYDQILPQVDCVPLDTTQKIKIAAKKAAEIATVYLKNKR